MKAHGERGFRNGGYNRY